MTPAPTSPDEHLTIARDAEAETKVLGSVFRARAFRVATADDVRAILADLRKREWDATHHVSAYRLADGTARADDDGEPSGSSGPPVLRQIDARALVDTLVVVARWFGGTKLGVGGLVRAYGDAAALALGAAGVRTVVARTTVVVRFAYADTSPALHAVSRVDALTLATDYGDDTALTLAVRQSDVARLVDAVREATGGRAEATVADA